MLKVALLMVISYLFGSIPWALVIGKTFYHKDIRKEGSGNLGASNAGRVLGKPAAISVTLLDALKAFFSMLLAWVLTGASIETSTTAVVLSGLACCIGHCYPIFAGFKGGKAVATTYGYLLGLTVLITHHYWWTFFWPIVLFFGILYLTRIVSISSISAIGIEVITTFILRVNIIISIALLVLWAFITWRHRANIERIKKGTESKIKWMGPVK